jgi:hypothetical protein
MTRFSPALVHQRTKRSRRAATVQHPRSLSCKLGKSINVEITAFAAISYHAERSSNVSCRLYTAEVGGSNPLGYTPIIPWPSTPCRLSRQPNHLPYQGERRRPSSASKYSIRRRCCSSSCRSRSRSPRRTTMLPASSARCCLPPKGSGAPCVASLIRAASSEGLCDVPRGAAKPVSSQSSPASVTV